MCHAVTGLTPFINYRSALPIVSQKPEPPLAAALGESHFHIGPAIQVNAFHEADLGGAQSHDHGRGSRAFAEESDSPHQRALGNSGGGKDELLAGREVFSLVDPVFVFNAHARDALFEFGLIDHQASLHVSIQAAYGGGGNHTFGRSAGAHHRVHSRTDDGCGNAGRKVAIADQADAGAGGANVGNQLFVARTVQHHYHKVFDIAVQALRNVFQVVDHRSIELDRTLAGGADDNLLHVAIGSEQQSSPLGGGQNRNR